VVNFRYCSSFSGSTSHFQHHKTPQKSLNSIKELTRYVLFGVRGVNGR
jgi:hypothetical protein